MSADEQTPAAAVAAVAADAAATETVVEQERSEKILKAKELCSQGSRNFLVKSYAEAADELSQVCQLYEELYGELSDELGMPYLLYAKSLIALALDENKVIDVPDEEEDNDDDDDDEDDAEPAADENAEATNGEAAATSNGKAAKLAKNEEAKSDTKADQEEEADSTCDEAKTEQAEKTAEAQVSSSNAPVETKPIKNGEAKATAAAKETAKNGATIVMDGEKPSTSNGKTSGAEEEDEEEENEAASNLQLAWEILELAAKIFTRQGVSGLPNLAEVHTELANIELENNILEAAREDYDKALKIYSELPTTNYRRAMAEIHYKIGLTYLMQQLNKEGAESLRVACELIDSEIVEIKEKTEQFDKDKNNIQDMEETKQEIWAKIAEIEETQAQNVAEVRAALDSFIKPISSSSNADDAGTSAAAGASSSSAITSSSPSSTASKPTDISHLIKRKKPEEATSEAEAASSPAKRPAV